MAGGVVVRELDGAPRARLALAWRRDDRRPIVRAVVEATAAVVASHP